MSNNSSEQRLLQQWLERLESLNPAHIELGLERSRDVLARMDLPCSGKIITVAGTNGKGTTVALLETLLGAQNYSIGAYTSPHIFHFRERIRFNGSPATDKQLIQAFEAVELARESTKLTYFEFTTLAAVYLFSQLELDFWLMEVGLGGRLDAVNLFDPEIALVTNVGIDHTDWLGETIEEIAVEKAGIFRESRPAIFASSSRPKTIDGTVQNIQAAGYFADRDFGICDERFWWLDKNDTQIAAQSSLSYSSETLAGALSVMACLGLRPTPEDIENLENFSMPARFQQLKVDKLNVIADVAHNADSTKFLATRLEQLELKAVTAVVGFMKDKPADELIGPMVNLVERWLVVRPDIDRAASVETIEQSLLSAGISQSNISFCRDISEIRESLGSSGTAVIYGSFYTVGECLSALGVSFD